MDGKQYRKVTIIPKLSVQFNKFNKGGMANEIESNSPRDQKSNRHIWSYPIEKLWGDRLRCENRNLLFDVTTIHSTFERNFDMKHYRNTNLLKNITEWKKKENFEVKIQNQLQFENSKNNNHH